MKFSKSVLFALLLAFLPALTFAGTKKTGEQSRDLTLYSPVQVGTQQLKAGDYKLRWNNSDATQVTFVQNGKEVATVPAHLVQDGSRTNATFETQTTSSGLELQRVYVKNGILEFGGSASAVGTAEPSGQQ